MICIAESGSTKTDWVIIDRDFNSEKLYVSKGLNPFYVTDQEVKQEVIRIIPIEVLESLTTIYFYGAGCSSTSRNDIIKSGLNQAARKAAVFIEHDLLGAARATSHSNPGIISILGTGSNSCKYDGKRIVDNIDNLGFVLGDEGSGSAIGKALIKARYYREMPVDLQQMFDEKFNISKDELLDRVYTNNEPNRYVASFSQFCSEQQKHPLIQNVIKDSFREFVKRNLLKYEEPEWVYHFVGSIAHFYSNELTEVFSEFDLKIGTIVKKPINQLVEYHRSGL